MRADAREVSMGVGHNLAKLEDLTSGAYLVRVNGAKVHWASARTPLSVENVLDRFESYCRESPSALGHALSDVPAALEGRIPIDKADPARAGVIRDATGARGMVACFVGEPGDRGDLPALSRRLDAFGRTGDLSQLGRFRYAFAERRTRDTRVVTVWTDGALDVARMFPASGDAPGTDPMFLPRPIRSRRTLSASLDGFPAGVWLYESEARGEELRADAERALGTSGFVPAAPWTSGARAFVRADGAEVLVSIRPTGDSRRRSVVSAVETVAAVRDIHVEIAR
ncbi:MAG: hypothetical protein R3B36_15695 [Polyangiaceae bacterium]